MLLEPCRFCEHVNPPDAKFCNACGGALHLIPCSRCGAVSDVTATVCYQCHSPLSGRGNIAPEAAQPAVEPPKALPRPHTRAVVGVAIVAVVVVVGYFGYRQASQIVAAHPPDATASDIVPVKRDDGIKPSNSVTVPPKFPLAGTVPFAASQPREGRREAESQVARVATAPVPRTKATQEASGTERAQRRPEPCTASAAALGLCTLKPAQAVGTEAAVSVKPVITRAKAVGAIKAAQQEGIQQEACTDGVAALGLCSSKSKEEGK